MRPLLPRYISRPRMCLLTRSTLHHEVHTTFAYELGLTELWGRLHFKPTAVRISTAGRSLLSLCDYSPGRASGVAKSNRFYQTPMTSFLPVSSLFRMMNKVYIKQLLNKSINKKSPIMELFIFSLKLLVVRFSNLSALLERHGSLLECPACSGNRSLNTFTCTSYLDGNGFSQFTTSYDFDCVERS